ncbi:MAG: polysaccharide biosynthesis protein [Bariatricus sp.]|nr:polysaccharide biosynthesis protein [Bariatricus sp.]
MSQKQALIRGTFILTFTGLLTRVIGFFYRIFLSRTFYAEGVGLYQLVFPVYALCFSFTTAALQVALSRLVAKYTALNQKEISIRVLKSALFISIILSLAAVIFIQSNAARIASEILHDERCSELLVAMSWAFPFASIHSCITGYYLGLKGTCIPALSQLIEQLVRVLSVFFLYQMGLHMKMGTPVTIAVFGLVFGEIASACYSIFMLRRLLFFPSGSLPGYVRPAWELVQLSFPLMASRVLLNFLQSAESILIPISLNRYGMTLTDSLSMYGVLTGMALPCILFPSAITNSVSTMLLPTVAEIQASRSEDKLPSLIRKVIFSCFLLGFLSMIAFLMTGNLIGNLIFHNTQVGKFIMTMAFICPFLYTNATLISILNGLGKTTSTFIINSCGLLIRIYSIYFLIPSYGILAYLHGLLASQLTITILSLLLIIRSLRTSGQNK